MQKGNENEGSPNETGVLRRVQSGGVTQKPLVVQEHAVVAESAGQKAGKKGASAGAELGVGVSVLLSSMKKEGGPGCEQVLQGLQMTALNELVAASLTPRPIR